MNDSKGILPTQLKKKSTKFPSLQLCPALDVFVKMVSDELQHLAFKKEKGWNNLNRKEWEALEALKKIKGVQINQADKGGNIVIWPDDMYERQAFKILNDKKWYKCLDLNPLLSFQNELDLILQKAVEKNIITANMKVQLMNSNSKIPTFYMIPKIHKNVSDPPGRPIISGNEGLSEKIGQFLDHYLKPLVETLPSFIQDTTAAINRLVDVQLDEKMYLVTADVETLYSNIKHQDGIQAIEKYAK